MGRPLDLFDRTLAVEGNENKVDSGAFEAIDQPCSDPALSAFGDQYSGPFARNDRKVSPEVVEDAIALNVPVRRYQYAG